MQESVWLSHSPFPEQLFGHCGTVNGLEVGLEEAGDNEGEAEGRWDGAKLVGAGEAGDAEGEILLGDADGVLEKRFNDGVELGC